MKQVWRKEDYPVEAIRFGHLLVGLGFFLLVCSLVPPFRFRRPAMLCGFRHEPRVATLPVKWADRWPTPVGLGLIFLGFIFLQ
ncbi:MAG: hypothetical protein NTY66_03910 [Candidatus Vogelbacteria bacterium]|nr:hypothetical protein [Candidatus Vogelbacteria bacterium]